MESSSEYKGHVVIWLLTTCFMVAAMAVIGAITRLTESGLSMVEWRPFIGSLPPISQAEWERVFALYQQTPEYIQINAGMSLDEFKNIFFWEWFHRLWGRLIGIIYALPLVFFWIKSMIPQGFKLKLLFGLFLGAGQAVMGWYMVESGFIDRPDVSHYRLAAHLSLAFIIFGYLLWLSFDLLKLPPSKVSYSFCKLRHGITAFILLMITIIWGAFVAGLDAGRIYNTWPLMGGQLTPPEAFGALIESHAWVQFFHRWVAALTFIFIISFAYRLKSIWLSIAVTAQFVLGMLTLISVLWMPLAVMHQFGALCLITAMLYELYRLNKNRLIQNK